MALHISAGRLTNPGARAWPLRRIRSLAVVSMTPSAVVWLRAVDGLAAGELKPLPHGQE